MRTSLAGLAGLVALLAACGGAGSRELTYGAAQAPTLAEQDAASQAQAQLDAQARLAAGAGAAPTGQPTAAGPGLADQLAATLGGDAAPDPGAPQLAAAGAAAAALPGGAPASLRRAVGRAVALPVAAVAGPSIDPACVAVGLTSVTWSGCVIDYTETDPVTLETLALHATIDGRLDWAPATGRTTWRITEVMAMTMTFDGETMRSDATVVLTGDVTSAAGAIVGQTASASDVTVHYMGLSASQGLRTSMALDLTHAADPFCITGGTLTLEQVWTRLPMGATRADYPDQGWRFEWTGCGLFTVSHGT